MDDVTVSLSPEVALVLVDWLGEESEHERLRLDAPTRQTLWNLEAVLEAKVDAVLAADYLEQVQGAKEVLRGIRPDRVRTPVRQLPPPPSVSLTLDEVLLTQAWLAGSDAATVFPDEETRTAFAVLDRVLGSVAASDATGDAASRLQLARQRMTWEPLTDESP